MENRDRKQAVAEFTKATHCNTITDGNDLLIDVEGQLYDLQQSTPAIKKLDNDYSWDGTGNIIGCYLEVYRNENDISVVLRLPDFFEYIENEELV